MRRARAGRVHLRSINYITSQTTTSLPNKQHHQILSTTPTKPHKMANGYVALAAAPVARKAEELTTPARMAIAGASSSASSSSSSFPPSHGSLVPRARLGRMFVVGFYTFFPLSAWSWLWSCSLSPPLLLLGSRSRSGLEQDRTRWDRLGSYFSREETHTLTRIHRTNSVWRSTLILSAWSCWLMWGTFLLSYHPSFLQACVTSCSTNLPSLSRRDRHSQANSQNQTAITFLAQWHPLIAPQRNDLRPEYNGAPAKSNGMF